jgi:hypothetical protein
MTPARSVVLGSGRFSYSWAYRVLLGCLLVTGVLFPLVAQPASAATQTQNGLIVPLYFYPGSGWNALIQAKLDHPTVPVVAIVNPDNGPGSTRNPTYATWIGKLQAAGIVVIGYDYTSYAARSLSAVKADVSAYKTLYGINGVFLDQMSNRPGHESYYSTITAYADSLGLSFVVGNPGDPVPASYIGTVDVVVVYESPGLPTIAHLASDTLGLSKTNFAMISYDVPSLSPSYIDSAAGYVKYIYMTSGQWPSPYSSLPSYLDILVADVGAASSGQTANINVKSITLSGSGLTGMRTLVKSSTGTLLASGFTPMVFQGQVGTAYTVCVENYQSYIFAHWDDLSTNACRTVTLTQTLWLVASYST